MARVGPLEGVHVRLDPLELEHVPALAAETGRLRDSVYFSMLAAEWPEIRARLQQRLDDHLTGAPPGVTR